jgi:hypothetical protein
VSAGPGLRRPASWVLLILFASATSVTASCHKRTPSESKPSKGSSLDSSREAREEAVLALVEGEVVTTSLPEMASEPGETLDLGLRNRLEPYAFETASDVRVTVGDVRGTPPLSNAARVVAGMRAGFRACYKLALEAAPSLAGALTMTLRLDATGGVVSARVAPNPAFPATFVTCIEKRAHGTRFDPLSGTSHAEVRFSVTVAPS